LRFDQTILLTGVRTARRYPDRLPTHPLALELSRYKILQILNMPFLRPPILEGFSSFTDEFADDESCMQLNLFDF
jgi:hypothetical protein